MASSLPQRFSVPKTRYPMISISPKRVLGATPTRINSILYKKRVNGHTPLPVVSILGCYYKTSTWTVCLGVAILIPRLLKVTSRRDYNARTSWFGESSKCILQCLLFLTTARPHGFSPPSPALHLGPPPCQAHVPLLTLTRAFVQYHMLQGVPPLWAKHLWLIALRSNFWHPSSMHFFLFPPIAYLHCVFVGPLCTQMRLSFNNNEIDLFCPKVGF